MLPATSFVLHLFGFCTKSRAHPQCDAIKISETAYLNFLQLITDIYVTAHNPFLFIRASICSILLCIVTEMPDSWAFLVRKSV